MSGKAEAGRPGPWSPAKRAAQLLSAAAVGLAGAASVAHAQEIGPDYFDPNREVIVTQRRTPGYDPQGLRAGSFLVFPRLSVDPEYNSNIYAEASNEVDDFIVRLRPEIAARSQWSRHELRFGARGVVSRFADQTSENSEEWSVDGLGRLDILTGDRLTVDGLYSDAIEPRTSTGSPNAAVRPIRFSLAQGRAVFEHVAGRVRLIARFDAQEYDFEDGRTATGAVVEQDDRDRLQLTYTGRVEYGVLADIAVFGQAAYNTRDHQEVPALGRPSRDSDGYQLLAGVRFDATELLRGSVGVGYLSQEFDEPGYGDFSGLNFDAALQYLPTRLTTVTLRATRNIGDSGIINAGSFLATTVGAQVDHELLRNLILTGTVARSRNNYSDVDRDERRWTLGARATYLLSDRYGASLQYSYDDQNSVGSAIGQEFVVNRLIASLFVRL